MSIDLCGCNERAFPFSYRHYGLNKMQIQHTVFSPIDAHCAWTFIALENVENLEIIHRKLKKLQNLTPNKVKKRIMSLGARLLESALQLERIR